MDWSKIPDVLAIASLACAFASISRSNRTAQHQLWLAGWIMIALHFLGFMCIGVPGTLGTVGAIIGLVGLIDAGIFFMWATVPHESGISSRRMALITVVSMSIYMVLTVLPNIRGWELDSCAVFIAIGPLAVALYYIRYSQHLLRWLTVGLQFALGAELLVLRRQSGGNTDLCQNAILFVVYIGCCLYFWHSHPNRTTGSTITIGGFLAWALVFVIAPLTAHSLPNFKIENEVWNLPKYVVAVGMLLLLLEKQIERSQYLALHDELTSLANRRLFQDRLDNTLERARRSGTGIALMQVDLDGFKEVNDTHGHHVGDLLLQHVAVLLTRRVRRSDTVARTGGDEFCIILDEPSQRKDAEQVADSLGRILVEPFQLDGKTIQVNASIGIAVYPEDAADAHTLCIEADQRMYRVKESRKESVGIRRQHIESPFESQTIAS